MFGFNKSVFLLALLCGITLVASNTCEVSIDQTIQSSWNSEGQVYTKVLVALTNEGSSNIVGLSLKIEDEIEGVWKMVAQSDNMYVLPDWRASSPIEPGQKHGWGYTIKSSDVATISVNKVGCEHRAARAVDPCATPAPSNPSNPATSAPTQRPTTPTSAPTQKPTSAPTQRPTSAPTQRPTSAPTQRPTSAPTQRPTSAPTQKPTTKPTSAPTSAPTSKATSAPTSKATSAPSAPGGKLCPAGSVWSPTPGTTWTWQISTTVDTSQNVQMYDIDLFDATPALINSLHAAGRAVICYFSTQYEDWRPDAKDFPSSILGNNLDDWAGERWVDSRSTVLRTIMGKRLDMAVSKGCDGVEPDNVDSASANNGFGLTMANQLDYNKWLANACHQRSLSVGLKNDLSQVTQLVSYFDWALNEQCNEYSECDDLTPFVTANKAVFGVEYTGSTGTFCPKMKNLKFSWWKKGEHLDASGTQCCTLTGGCSSAPYSCKSVSKRSIDFENETESLIETAEDLVVEAENLVAEPTNPDHEQHSAASAVFALPFLALAAAVALAF